VEVDLYFVIGNGLASYHCRIYKLKICSNRVAILLAWRIYYGIVQCSLLTRLQRPLLQKQLWKGLLLGYTCAHLHGCLAIV